MKIKQEELERVLKKQKILFAMWSASSKNEAPYQNYYLPLKNIFGKTILFDPRKERFSRGSEKMNQMFSSLIKKEMPDYIFLIVGRDELTIQTMAEIKKISPKIKVIAFVGDDDTEFETLKRYQALFVDCNFIAQPNYVAEYKKEGIKNVFPTISINTDIFKPIKTKKIYDVTFIGQPSKPRLDIVRFLLDKKVNLKIFGRGWENYPEFRDVYLGSPDSEKFVKIVNQSKINLAFSKNRYGKLHFKGRIFEFAACKSFSLVDFFSGYLKFFKNNEEIVMFKNNEELLKKIAYYLKNETAREKIAEKSYTKAIKNHNISQEYQKLFGKMLENENVFSSKLIKSNKKMKMIKKEEVKNFDYVKKITEGFDYICFSSNDSENMEYLEYLRSRAMDVTKKQISICDYYFFDKLLGNLLLVDMLKSFNELNLEEFERLIIPEQIAVSREYLLENYHDFENLLKRRKNKFFRRDIMSFISIPLVKTTKIGKLNYPVFSNVFQKIFLFTVYSMIKQKNLKVIFYVFRLLAIKNVGTFTAKFFFSSLFKSENWNKLRM
ncbi:TPA: hypothetical protein DIU22_03535 [Candidatus Woesebacteria bacterium]|nr:hypothetical protein [Candidatus Woesebacteria bacterium]HLA23032.1 glycosyltransferase [Candidatus Nanoarchaeia archaeon]